MRPVPAMIGGRWDGLRACIVRFQSDSSRRVHAFRLAQTFRAPTDLVSPPPTTTDLEEKNLQ